jgi:hypothetical protein
VTALIHNATEYDIYMQPKEINVNKNVCIFIAKVGHIKLLLDKINEIQGGFDQTIVSNTFSIKETAGDK